MFENWIAFNKRRLELLWLIVVKRVPTVLFSRSFWTYMCIRKIRVCIRGLFVFFVPTSDPRGANGRRVAGFPTAEHKFKRRRSVPSRGSREHGRLSIGPAAKRATKRRVRFSRAAECPPGVRGNVCGRCCCVARAWQRCLESLEDGRTAARAWRSRTRESVAADEPTERGQRRP